MGDFEGGVLCHSLLFLGGRAVTVFFACGITIVLMSVWLGAWYVHIGTQVDISALWCPWFRPDTLEAYDLLEQCDHVLVSHMNGDEVVTASVLSMVIILHVAEGLLWLVVIVSAP